MEKIIQEQDVSTSIKFLFSDESSSLNKDEYKEIKNIILKIKKIIKWRKELHKLGLLDIKTAFPSGNWDPQKTQVFELNDEHSSFMTSFNLIMKKDIDIIKKLRLYSQAFSGYQLATLTPAIQRPWIKSKLPKNYDVFLKMLVSNPDESVDKFLNILKYLPKEYHFSFPLKFGEIGWVINDMLINKDAYMYLERICLLYECGILERLKKLSETKIINILEIGSGFGGLAYFIKKIIPNSHIILIDLPESLIFSNIYLKTIFPKENHNLLDSENQKISIRKGFTYISNYNVPMLKFKNIDLAINTLSFAEMEISQVISYCELIKKSLSKNGLLFEQNFNTSHNVPKDLFNIIKKVLNNPQEIKSNIIPKLEKGIPHIWTT
jgi:hypothetical protein